MERLIVQIGLFFCAKNEPCTDAKHVLRELARSQNKAEATVYGEAATSTDTKWPEMPTRLIGFLKLRGLKSPFFVDWDMRGMSETKVRNHSSS